LEELTYVSRFIITFQLLMCLFCKRRTGGFCPPATQHT